MGSGGLHLGLTAPDIPGFSESSTGLAVPRGWRWGTPLLGWAQQTRTPYTIKSNVLAASDISCDSYFALPTSLRFLDFLQ